MGHCVSDLCSYHFEYSLNSTGNVRFFNLHLKKTKMQSIYMLRVVEVYIVVSVMVWISSITSHSRAAWCLVCDVIWDHLRTAPLL